MKTSDLLRQGAILKTSQILKIARRRQSALDDDEVLAKLAASRKRGLVNPSKDLK